MKPDRPSRITKHLLSSMAASKHLAASEHLAALCGAALAPGASIWTIDPANVSCASCRECYAADQVERALVPRGRIHLTDPENGIWCDPGAFVLPADELEVMLPKAVTCTRCLANWHAAGSPKQ